MCCITRKGRNGVAFTGATACGRFESSATLPGVYARRGFLKSLSHVYTFTTDRHTSNLRTPCCVIKPAGNVHTYVYLKWTPALNARKTYALSYMNSRRDNYY